MSENNEPVLQGEFRMYILQHERDHAGIDEQIKEVAQVKNQLRDIKWLMVALLVAFVGNTEAATKVIAIAGKLAGH